MRRFFGDYSGTKADDSFLTRPPRACSSTPPIGGKVQLPTLSRPRGPIRDVAYCEELRWNITKGRGMSQPQCPPRLTVYLFISASDV